MAKPDVKNQKSVGENFIPADQLEQAVGQGPQSPDMTKEIVAETPADKSEEEQNTGADIQEAHRIINRMRAALGTLAAIDCPRQMAADDVVYRLGNVNITAGVIREAQELVG
jgi:hypothetical protein